jgi:hypothetical protein
MPIPSEQSSVLVLDRAGTGCEPAVDGPARPASDPGPSPDEPPRAAPSDALLRAPGLALLAAWSVLEGYRSFGVIGEGGSRPWAVAFAAAALIAALALTRAEGRRARSGTERLVVAAAVAVVVATVAVLWNHGGWSWPALGIADLVLASMAVGALVAGERSRRRIDVPA